MPFMRYLFISRPCAAKPAISRLHLEYSLLLALLALPFWLGGCGTVSKNSSTTTPTPTPTPNSGTFAISGTVTPASAGSGTTLTLSGPSAATATADSSGNYSFTGLVNGTYVVTPTHSGDSFSPTLQTVTLNGANANSINFTASQQATHSVTLSWHASTTAVSGYNVYRATTNGGPYSKINSSIVTMLSYTDTSVNSGGIYYYVSTSIDSSGIESAYSNQATAAIP